MKLSFPLLGLLVLSFCVLFGVGSAGYTEKRPIWSHKGNLLFDKFGHGSRFWKRSGVPNCSMDNLALVMEELPILIEKIEVGFQNNFFLNPLPTSKK